MGGSAIGHQFSQHGAQTKDQHQEPKRTSDSFLYRFYNAFKFHSLKDPNHKADDDKRKEGIEFEYRDKEEK